MTAVGETVLVLRCSSRDGTSYNDFRWPDSGEVAAPDWRNDTECGHGLHGWLWGEGDVRAATWHDQPDARWYIVEVLAVDVVDLGGKVKFPRGNVILRGSRDEVVKSMQERCPGRAVVYGQATAGEKGTIILSYWCPKRDRYRSVVGEIGEDGLEPNVTYVLDENHRFVPAKG